MFIVHVHCSLFMFIVHCSHGATLIFDDLFRQLVSQVRGNVARSRHAQWWLGNKVGIPPVLA